MPGPALISSKAAFGAALPANLFSRLVGLPVVLRLLAAASLGAAAALAFAPWHLIIVLPIAFTGLVWLLDGAARRRDAFFIGWLFGIGFFIVGLHWVGHAFLVDAARFGWMMPGAVGGLAAGLALFPALACLAAHAAPAGWSRLLALSAAWAVAEWLRGHILTGFPWHSLGYVWTFSDATLQSASLFGVYGLSAITVTAACVPALLAGARPARRRDGVAALAVVVAVLVGLWGFGALRLATTAVVDQPDVLLRIVQGGIPQADKWRRELRDQHLQTYLDLSSRSAEQVTDLIWPETATPFLLEDDALRRADVAAAIPGGGLLITGTPRRRIDAAGNPMFFNGVVALTDADAIAGRYDKAHLVPFGEYLPFRPLLARVGLDKLAAGPLDYTAGPGPAVMALPGLPAVRPLICYEILFPGEVRAPERPGWLLNLTNDAWFGNSAGPVQHFDIARMRAAELGLPVVRAANTGISGVIDPLGRSGPVLGIGAAGFLDARLPAPIAPTLYARTGDFAFWIIVVALFVGSVVTAVTNRSD